MTADSAAQPARRPRALDLATGVGAAYTTKLLAEVGWDVVKVEPKDGEAGRLRGGRWGSGEGGAFAFVNHGKRWVEGDAEIIEGLANSADVVVGDFSIGGCTESGLDAALFQTLEPRGAVVSVSPFGLSGPRSSWAASDLVIQAASGLMFLTGEYDQPPMQLPPYAASMAGGIAAASAALAANRSARKDGVTRRVDVAMVEAMAGHTYSQTSGYVSRGEVFRREQRVKQGLRMVPASDRFVYCAPGAVATMDMKGVAVLLNEPRLAEDRFQTAEGRMQHYQEFLDLFVPPFQRQTAQEWFEQAEKLHLTFALVQTVDDLFSCPQLEARDFMRTIPGPRGFDVRVPGRPFRLEGGPAEADRPWSEDPGEHTIEVLHEWLGAPSE